MFPPHMHRTTDCRCYFVRSLPSMEHMPSSPSHSCVHQECTADICSILDLQRILLVRTTHTPFCLCCLAPILLHTQSTPPILCHSQNAQCHKDRTHLFPPH